MANLFDDLPANLPEELVEVFAENEDMRIECNGRRRMNRRFGWLHSTETDVHTHFAIQQATLVEHLEVVHEARKLLRSLYQASGVIQQPGKTASVALYHPHTPFLRSLVPKIAAEFQKWNWPIRVSMTWLYINCDLQYVNKATAIDRLMNQNAVRTRPGSLSFTGRSTA